jgi:predicted nucleotidyltransferase
MRSGIAFGLSRSKWVGLGLGRVSNIENRGAMMPQKHITQIQSLLQEQLPVLAKRYSVSSLALFGSYVRHEDRPDSDLDILVTFSKTPSLLRFIELENYLSDFLGVKVDLVMPDTLKPQIGKKILQEVVPI